MAPAHLVRQLAQGAEATAGLQAEDLEGLRDDHALLGVERGRDAFEGLFLIRGWWKKCGKRGKLNVTHWDHPAGNGSTYMPFMISSAAYQCLVIYHKWNCVPHTDRLSLIIYPYTNQKPFLLRQLSWISCLFPSLLSPSSSYSDPKAQHVP